MTKKEWQIFHNYSDNSMEALESALLLFSTENSKANIEQLDIIPISKK